MTMNIKKISKVINIVLIISIFISVKPITFASTINFNPLVFIEKLSSQEYKGKQSGTLGYDNAVAYIEKQMREVGMLPILDPLSYKQPYETKIGTLKESKVLINGKNLILMKDYMVNARSSSATVDTDKIYYAGTGLEKDFIGMPFDSIAIFKYKDSTGNLPLGISDRALLAKSKGAKAVFVIVNYEYKIGDNEHPIGATDNGIPIIYISEEVASKIFNTSMTDTPSKMNDTKVSLKINIERKSAKSNNLIGVIPGIREDKAILIVSNIDGFGTLPDGSSYPSTIASVVSPAVMLDLAKYYSEHQPKYTLIFAMVGSKWTTQDGIKALVDKIDFTNIVTTLDLYAMGTSVGGNQAINVNYVDPAQIDLAKNISAKIDKSNIIYNSNDFGNASSSQIIKSTKNLFMLRQSGSWIDDSMLDQVKNLDKLSYIASYEAVKKTIDTLITDFEQPSEYQYTMIPKSEINNEVNQTYSYRETKYFKVYYEVGSSADLAMNIQNLKEMDVVYEKIMALNYYPALIGTDKFKVYIINDKVNIPILLDRKDLIGRLESAGGGSASKTRSALYMKQFFLGTLSHELNHTLASLKGIATTTKNHNNIYQEVTGNTHNVFYSLEKTPKPITDASIMINQYFYSYEAADFKTIANDYKNLFKWEWFYKNGVDYNGKWQNTYKTLGSMITYIKYNYGESTARRVMTRIYEMNTKQYNNDDVQAAFLKEINVSPDQFLEAWSKWVISSGNDLVNTNGYEDKKTSYDFAKIYTKEIVPMQNITTQKVATQQSDVSNAIDINKLPVIKSNQKTFFVNVDDGLTYQTLDYRVWSNSHKTLVLKSFGAAQDTLNMYVKIKVDTPVCGFVACLVNDTPGLMFRKTLAKKGENTIILKFSKSDIVNLPEKIVISFHGGNTTNSFTIPKFK